MLLLHSFDTEDRDIEILLVDALSKIPSSVELGFKIDLESLDEQTCIDLPANWNYSRQNKGMVCIRTLQTLQLFYSGVSNTILECCTMLLQNLPSNSTLHILTTSCNK